MPYDKYSMPKKRMKKRSKKKSMKYNTSHGSHMGGMDYEMDYDDGDMKYDYDMMDYNDYDMDYDKDDMKYGGEYNWGYGKKNGMNYDPDYEMKSKGYNTKKETEYAMMGDKKMKMKDGTPYNMKSMEMKKKKAIARLQKAKYGDSLYELVDAILENL